MYADFHYPYMCIVSIICVQHELFYNLNDKEKYRDVKIFEEDAILPTYSGGWFYSSSVPEEWRCEIDLTLLDMRLENKFQQVMDKYVVPEVRETCGTTNNLIA